MLYRSNKLMYDRSTETLWHQFRGEPVVGPLAGSGIRLEVLPNVLTTWEEWLATHPDTTVIARNTGVYPAQFYTPEDNESSIYYEYRAARDTMFPVGIRDDDLAVKEPVFGLSFGGEARAYPRSALSLAPALNDTVGGQEVVIVTTADGGTRAYDRQGLRFQFSNDDRLLDNDGNEWSLSEDALESESGTMGRLPRLPSRDAYWFGWYAFYPHTDLYKP